MSFQKRPGQLWTHCPKFKFSPTRLFMGVIIIKDFFAIFFFCLKTAKKDNLFLLRELASNKNLRVTVIAWACFFELSLKILNGEPVYNSYNSLFSGHRIVTVNLWQTFRSNKNKSNWSVWKHDIEDISFFLSFIVCNNVIKPIHSPLKTHFWIFVQIILKNLLKNLQRNCRNYHAAKKPEENGNEKKTMGEWKKKSCFLFE